MLADTRGLVAPSGDRWLSIAGKCLESVANRLPPNFGGCGNDAMLTTFRISLSEGLTSRSGFVNDRRVGTLGLEFVWLVAGGTGIFKVREGARNASFDGNWGVDGDCNESEEAGRLFLTLEVGKTGRAEVGGGKDGRGILTAIVPRGPTRWGGSLAMHG